MAKKSRSAARPISRDSVESMLRIQRAVDEERTAEAIAAFVEFSQSLVAGIRDGSWRKP